MPNPEQERLDAISNGLATLVRRLNDIERRMERLERASGLEPAPATVFAPPPVAPQPSPQLAPPPPEMAAQVPPQPVTPAMPSLAAPPPPIHPINFSAPTPRPAIDETQMGLTWVNRIGVVTLILGVAFFFRYAIDNQWIGETGRVVLGILAGLGCIAAADRLWFRGQRVFAQGISGLGIALLYLSFYAGFGFYHFLPQPVAFLLMLLTTTTACALALRYNALPMAVLGFLGGYLTPALLSTGQDAPWALFSYVFLLNAGATWMAQKRRWRTLEVLAFVGTAMLWLGWFSSFFAPSKTLPATVSLLVYYPLFAWALSPFVAIAAQIAAALGMAAVWDKDPLPAMPLLLLVAAAGLVVSQLRPRPSLALWSFSSFWLAYGLWASEAPQNIPVQLGAITAGFILFAGWLIWRIYIRRWEPGYPEYSMLALNGPAYYTFSYALLAETQKPWMGLFALVLAGLHLLMAYEIWNSRGRPLNHAPTLLAAGIAIGFVTIAIPIQLTGFSITLAWAIEAAALSYIASRLSSDRFRLGASLILLLAVGRFIGYEWTHYNDPNAYSLLVNGRFFAGFFIAVAGFLAAYWNRDHIFGKAGYVLGHLILIATLLAETYDWIFRTTSPANGTSAFTVASSVLLAFYALMLVAAGVSTRVAAHRLTGLVLLGIVVLKLYILDVWELGRLFRTVAFVGLGVLLLATSYLYSRFRPTLTRFLRDESATGEGSAQG
jgi:uncharacterized membrane protein